MLAAGKGAGVEHMTRVASAPGFAGKVGSVDEVVAGQPALTDEAIGWLAHLHRKVTFGGTWTKNDTIHPSWDNRSFAPRGDLARYDFTWAQWAIGLMIDATPAWREVYGTILRYMGDRFLEYQSLWEWVEQRGDDPKRKDYPPEYAKLMPPGQFGTYNMIGWAGNGSGPYDYDPDPVRGNGSCNLMYKGYLNLVLSMYAYATGDTRYDSTFRVVYDDDFTFEYDHRAINELIARQWRQNWQGISCEVTKIFPWCNNLTAVGMRLFDVMHGTRYSWEYHNWKRYFSDHYIGPSDGPVEWLTHYHDPQLGAGLSARENQGAHNYAVNVWHGHAFDPALFERLYDGMIRHFYREQPDGSAFLAARPDDRTDMNVATGLGAAVALELGDVDRHMALRAWIDSKYGPTWDTAEGEFYLSLGLGEDWPRGQYNDWIMPAFTITGPGQWGRLVTDPNVGKFREPTIEGVDYPTLRPRQARYDGRDRVLYASFTTANPAALGTPTSFVVSNLHGRFRVTLDHQEIFSGEPDGGRLTVATTVGPHVLIAQQVNS